MSTTTMDTNGDDSENINGSIDDDAEPLLDDSSIGIANEERRTERRRFNSTMSQPSSAVSSLTLHPLQQHFEQRHPLEQQQQSEAALDSVNALLEIDAATAATTAAAVDAVIAAHSLHLPVDGGPVIDCKNTLYSHPVADIPYAVVKCESTLLFLDEHEIGDGGAAAVTPPTGLAATEHEDSRGIEPQPIGADGFYKQIWHGVQSLAQSVRTAVAHSVVPVLAVPTGPTDHGRHVILELQNLPREPVQPVDSETNALIYDHGGRPINVGCVDLDDMEDRALLEASTPSAASFGTPASCFKRLWTLYRWNILIVLAAVVLLAMLVTRAIRTDTETPTDLHSATPPVAQSSLRRNQQVVAYINNVTLSGQNIALLDATVVEIGLDQASAEQAALQWLVYNDPQQLLPNTTANSCGCGNSLPWPRYGFNKS